MKIIEVTILPTGEAIVQTKGFSGPACLAASRFLEDALGDRGPDRKTNEYYAAPVTAQQENRQ